MVETTLAHHNEHDSYQHWIVITSVTLSQEPSKDSRDPRWIRSLCPYDLFALAKRRRRFLSVDPSIHWISISCFCRTAAFAFRSTPVGNFKQV